MFCTIFVLSSTVLTFTSSDISIDLGVITSKDGTVLNNEDFVIADDRIVIQSRVNGQFKLTNASTTGFKNIYTTNNWINETLKITPIAFGTGITSVDILVKWSSTTNTGSKKLYVCGA